MRRKIAVSVVAFLYLAAFGVASEYPEAASGSASLASALANIPEHERSNALIDIVLAADADQSVVALTEKAERLWNDGNWSTAIELLENLSSEICRSASIAVSWCSPIPTADSHRWDPDVRIGNLDSIYVVDFDVHMSSGALFVVLANYSDDNWHRVAIYRSGDDGATWWEHMYVSQYGTHSPDVACAVQRGHCYYAYVHSYSDVCVRRIRVSDGSPENMPNGASYVTVYSPFAVPWELELFSAEELDPAFHGLGLVAIHSDGEMPLCTSPDTGVSWYYYTLGVDWASRGLDIALNPRAHPGGYWLFTSFIRNDNAMDIGGVDEFNVWHGLAGGNAGNQADYTAIGAYHDTVFCAYDGMFSGHQTCWLAVSQNGGSLWDWYFLAASSAHETYSPDITLRGGDGIATVYSRDYGMTVAGRFRWRPFWAVGFDPPVTYTNYFMGNPKPALEHMGGGVYGVVYVSRLNPRWAAFFDKGSACCNDDGIRGNADGLSSAGGEVDVADLTYLVAYLFQAGPEPPCLDEGNVDGTVGAGGPVDVADLTYLVSYLFLGGPSPAPCP